jgi:hypothetical protein
VAIKKEGRDIQEKQRKKPSKIKVSARTNAFFVTFVDRSYSVNKEAHRHGHLQEEIRYGLEENLARASAQAFK